MDTMLACLFVTILLPYAPRLFTFRAQMKMGFNNHEPRNQQAKLTGLGARALGAHNNSFEALLLFTAAVFIAHTTGVDPGLAGRLSVAFVTFRVAYIALYLLDKPSARSTVWVFGFVTTVILAGAKWIF
jgi:uncharacterized MAPEG superfamily protein